MIIATLIYATTVFLMIATVTFAVVGVVAVAFVVMFVGAIIIGKYRQFRMKRHYAMNVYARLERDTK